MADTALTRDQIAQEAMNILSTLRDNSRASRSNKLADVKGTFENTVSIDFDTYFFFLRKYHFIGMDREACLQLTPEGEKIVDGEKRERFLEAVQEYFASRIVEEPVQSGQTEILADSSMVVEGTAIPPPPPMSGEDEPLDAPRAAAGAGSSGVTVSVNVPPPPPPASIYGSPLASRQGTSERGRGGRRNEPEPPPTSTASLGKPPPPEPGRPGEPKGQEIDLRYVKFDVIGQGPLGTVYKGRHNALGLDVAVKELKDIFGYFSFLQRSEVIKRLKKEICAQALVRHPTVVSVLDQNCDIARPYYVVELCTGGNLRAKLDAAGGKGIVPEVAVRYFLQICYALRAAHAQGLVHGNLKPENVLIDHLGNVKLGDFGLSRVIEVDASKGMPQVFVGTGGMGYMSPEQLARSNKDFGPVTDVYGMGILFYEMLTGQLPGRRSPLPSSVNAKVPSKLDPLFDKMTQDRREERYPDFDAVLGDFYAAFDDGAWLKKGDLVLSCDAVAPKAEAEAPKAEAKPKVEVKLGK
jgi:eukaryotic-like serine/threonine-protein kinase